MEKKKLELTTGLVGMSGYFCTYHGYAGAEYVLHEDTIQQDFEEGLTDIHPDYYWRHFDNSKYMEVINKRTHEIMDEFLTDLFKHELDMDITYVADGYNCPQFYNFREDRHNFDIEADTFQPLIDFCINHKDFPNYLKEKYSSRDGFISFTSNTVEEILEDLKVDQMTAWGALVSFFIDQHLDEDSFTYEVIEKLGQDMLYTEFVDYTVLDAWMEDLKAGRIADCDLESEWQEALFDRYIGNHGLLRELVNDGYTTQSPEQVVEQFTKLLSLEESVRPLALKAVEKMFAEIADQTLKLDL
jgi:hypothetical protein